MWGWSWSWSCGGSGGSDGGWKSWRVRQGRGARAWEDAFQKRLQGPWIGRRPRAQGWCGGGRGERAEVVEAEEANAEEAETGAAEAEARRRK